MEQYDWERPIRANIMQLKFTGLWPKGDGYKFNGYAIYGIIAHFIINLHNVVQTIHICLVYYDLQAVAAALFITITDLFATMKCYYFVKGMRSLKRLMNILKSDDFQPRTMEQRESLESFLYTIKVACYIFWLVTNSQLLFMAIYPIVDESNRENPLPFFAWYPYDSKKSPYYELTYFHQVASIWYLAIANWSIDLQLSAMMLFTAAQCYILSDDVKRLPNSTNLNDYNKNLLKCIQHHKKILTFGEEANKLLSMLALGQLVTSVLSLTLALFQLTLTKILTSEFSVFYHFVS